MRLSGGMGAGVILTGLYGCEPIGFDPDVGPEVNPEVNPEINPEDLVYGDFKNKVLSSGIESPAGISLYGRNKKSSLKSAGNSSSLEDIIFCGGPLINGSETGFVNKPTIFNYQGDFNTVNILYEFGDENLDLFTFFTMDLILTDVGMPIEMDGETVKRPMGLNSDTAILGDGSVLFSTIKSNKIFDLTGGVKNIYLENNNLIGINNMIYGTDDKLYLAQVAIRDEFSQTVRPKRILSIDSDKNLNVEFELPSDSDSSFHEYIEPEVNSLYGGNNIEVGTQVRIIENLDQKFDPSRFFVMDQYNRAIYKRNRKGDLENVLKDVSSEVFPSGIAAQINGKIFYITSPVLYSASHPNYSGNLAFDSQLRMIDPKNGKENVLYTFEGLDLATYISERGIYEVEIENLPYWLPVNHLMTLGAVQIENDLAIYYTDNVLGDVGELNATSG